MFHVDIPLVAGYLHKPVQSLPAKYNRGAVLLPVQSKGMACAFNVVISNKTLLP